MGVALRHDRRFMPQEPLHLIQIYPGLNHPRCERMAKMVEMEILNLRTIERGGHSSLDVAPIKGCLAFAGNTISVVCGVEHNMSTAPLFCYPCQDRWASRDQKKPHYQSLTGCPCPRRILADALHDSEFSLCVMILFMGMILKSLPSS